MKRTMQEQQLAAAAEALSDRAKTAPLSDPLLRHLEAVAPEFLRSKGFDVGTRAGCLAALRFLRSAKVEEAFWNETAIPEEGSGVNNAADWYIGEARLDRMRRVIEHRLEEFFPGDGG